MQELRNSVAANPIARFEACSTVTRVLACTAIESPRGVRVLRSALGHLVTPTTRSGGFRLERGLAIPHSKRRFATRLPEIREGAGSGLGGWVWALLPDMLSRKQDRRCAGPCHRSRTGGGGATIRSLRAAAGDARHRGVAGDGIGGGDSTGTDHRSSGQVGVANLEGTTCFRPGFARAGKLSL